jgi:hypothetical protein
MWLSPLLALSWPTPFQLEHFIDRFPEIRNQLAAFWYG